MKEVRKGWVDVLCPESLDTGNMGLMFYTHSTTRNRCFSCVAFHEEECKKYGICFKQPAYAKHLCCDTYEEVSKYRPGQPLMMGTGQFIDEETPATDGAMNKPNAGKPQHHMLDPYMLDQIAAVLEFGAQKYEKWNWVKGYPYSTIFDSLMRHLWAWWGGENDDPESGLPHLAHAGCNLMFLMNYSRPGRAPGGVVDDRPHFKIKEMFSAVREARVIKREGGDE